MISLKAIWTVMRNTVHANEDDTETTDYTVVMDDSAEWCVTG